MAGSWKINIRRTAPGGSGKANGEFSRLSAALAFADCWLSPGWSGTITNPAGVTVDLEKGKRPKFPPASNGDVR
jgi:hypothetical protein